MRLMKNDEYNLLERLVTLTQSGMHKAMSTYLQSKYKSVIVHDKYIVALGDIPIALVAHMDTVFKYPVDNMYYDTRKGVIWSPEGLGADDRAGIFAIIQIIQSGLRPSIILTTDEESGAAGARALAAEPCPIPDLKYMIQLDRRGSNDCVFYDCYNPEFITYVENFGFVERWGTFSDISVLMPAWKICGVNLSVGYQDEHSVSEVLFVNSLFSTIAKVTAMLKEQEIPFYEYKEGQPYWYKGWNYRSSGYEEEIYGAHCAHCNDLYSEYEMFPVRSKSGLTKLYCTDCVVDHANWCVICGEAYEKTSSQYKNHCAKCAEEKSKCIKK